MSFISRRTAEKGSSSSFLYSSLMEQLNSSTAAATDACANWIMAGMSDPLHIRCGYEEALDVRWWIDADFSPAESS